jgi:hypothetical protein
MKKKEEKKIETQQVTEPPKTAHFVYHTLEKSQQHFHTRNRTSQVKLVVETFYKSNQLNSTVPGEGSSAYRRYRNA